jgi:DNA-3-methyladenine glycosylase I
LRKREGYRRAFGGFDPARIARLQRHAIDRLTLDPRIVRHRGKVESVVLNARAVLELERHGGSFSSELWKFVGDRPKRNAWRSQDRVPAESAESRAMSRYLRSRGFRFVGPTICYAFMQAVGMVNDHLVGCFRYREVGR